MGFWTVSEILSLKWTGWDGTHPRGTPGRCYWMRLIITKKKICVYCGDLNGFWDIRHFMRWRGGACPWRTTGDPRSTSLNASYHKEEIFSLIETGAADVCEVNPLLLVPCYLFLVTCSLLLNPCYLLLVPCYLFLVSCYLFLVTYSFFLLLKPCYLFHVTYSWFLVTC